MAKHDYEDPKVMVKEIEYMKKGGAPKSLIKHEQREHEQMKREQGKKKGK